MMIALLKVKEKDFEPLSRQERQENQIKTGRLAPPCRHASGLFDQGMMIS
jgi:hypothetical protein